MINYADYDDATIHLVYRTCLTHAVALESGITAAPLGAMLLLSQWKEQTLRQCLKRQIQARLLRMDMPGSTILEMADRRRWLYLLTYAGTSRALELVREGRELWQPPIYQSHEQARISSDRMRKKAAAARRHVGVGT
jgi:hypothetical protein